MSDYFIPLMIESENKEESTKEMENEERKEDAIQATMSSGMGDFSYEVPPKDHSELMEVESLENLNEKTQSLMNHLEDGLANSFQECRSLEESLDQMEGEMKKRKDLFDLCISLFKDEVEQIEQCSKKISMTDNTISHHEEVVESWRYLINQFRRVPDE